MEKVLQSAALILVFTGPKLEITAIFSHFNFCSFLTKLHKNSTKNVNMAAPGLVTLENLDCEWPRN